MKTAVIYARVSDKKQVEKNLSIPAQMEACEERAKKLNLNVVKIYLEKGKSAWYGNRPEFEDAITYCEVNEVDYFITWDTARFSRDHVNGPLSRYRLRSAGTKIEYLTVDIDPETDGGFILETVYQLTDELKSRKTSADTKRSMIKNAQSGYFNGGQPPFGFKVVSALDDDKRKKLQKDMQEAPVVKKIFELRLNGLGAKSIAGNLNERGISNRGRIWNKTTILNLLRSHAVIGKIVFNKHNRRAKKIRDKSEWIIVESHEPIVSYDDWKSVQNLMDSAAPTVGSSSPKSNHLFTGILKCGKCNSSMQVETAKGRNKRYSYYNCRNKQKKNMCENRRISTEELDYFLIVKLADKIFNKKLLLKIAEEIQTLSGSWQKDQAKKVRVINSKIESTKKKRSKIYSLLENTDPEDLNLSHVKPRLLEHNNSIQELERQLFTVNNEKQPYIPVIENDVDDLLAICRSYLIDTSRIKEVRGFLSTFVEKVEIMNDSVKIHYKPEHLIAVVSGGPVHSEERWLPNLGSNQGHKD